MCLWLDSLPKHGAQKRSKQHLWGNAPHRQRGGELKMTREIRKRFLVTRCISLVRYIGGGVSCEDGSLLSRTTTFYRIDYSL